MADNASIEEQLKLIAAQVAALKLEVNKVAPIKSSSPVIDIAATNAAREAAAAAGKDPNAIKIYSSSAANAPVTIIPNPASSVSKQVEQSLAQAKATTVGLTQQVNEMAPVKVNEPAVKPVQVPTIPAVKPESIAIPAVVMPEDVVKLGNMTPGMSGDNVKELQLWLKQQGYFPAGTDATGYYGDITKNALAQWQADHGVDTQGNAGFFGPATKAKINEVGGAVNVPPVNVQAPLIGPVKPATPTIPVTSDFKSAYTVPTIAWGTVPGSQLPTYTVGATENIQAILSKFNITFDELRAVNPGLWTDVWGHGKTLNLPAKAAAQMVSSQTKYQQDFQNLVNRLYKGEFGTTGGREKMGNILAEMYPGQDIWKDVYDKIPNGWEETAFPKVVEQPKSIWGQITSGIGATLNAVNKTVVEPTLNAVYKLADDTKKLTDSIGQQVQTALQDTKTTITNTFTLENLGKAKDQLVEAIADTPVISFTFGSTPIKTTWGDVAATVNNWLTDPAKKEDAEKYLTAYNQGQNDKGDWDDSLLLKDPGYAEGKLNKITDKIQALLDPEKGTYIYDEASGGFTINQDYFDKNVTQKLQPYVSNQLQQEALDRIGSTNKAMGQLMNMLVQDAALINQQIGAHTGDTNAKALIDNFKKLLLPYSDMTALDPTLSSWALDMKRFSSSNVEDIAAYYSGKTKEWETQLRSLWGDAAVDIMQNAKPGEDVSDRIQAEILKSSPVETKLWGEITTKIGQAAALLQKNAELSAAETLVVNEALSKLTKEEFDAVQDKLNLINADREARSKKITAGQDVLQLIGSASTFSNFNSVASEFLASKDNLEMYRKYLLEGNSPNKEAISLIDQLLQNQTWFEDQDAQIKSSWIARLGGCQTLEELAQLESDFHKTKNLDPAEVTAMVEAFGAMKTILNDGQQLVSLINEQGKAVKLLEKSSAYQDLQRAIQESKDATDFYSTDLIKNPGKIKELFPSLVKYTAEGLGDMFAAIARPTIIPKELVNLGIDLKDVNQSQLKGINIGDLAAGAWTTLNTVWDTVYRKGLVPAVLTFIDKERTAIDLAGLQILRWDGELTKLMGDKAAGEININDWLATNKSFLSPTTIKFPEGMTLDQFMDLPESEKNKIMNDNTVSSFLAYNNPAAQQTYTIKEDTRVIMRDGVVHIGTYETKMRTIEEFGQLNPAIQKMLLSQSSGAWVLKAGTTITIPRTDSLPMFSDILAEDVRHDLYTKYPGGMLMLDDVLPYLFSDPFEKVYGIALKGMGKTLTHIGSIPKFAAAAAAKSDIHAMAKLGSFSQKLIEMEEESFKCLVGRNYNINAMIGPESPFTAMFGEGSKWQKVFKTNEPSITAQTQMIQNMRVQIYASTVLKNMPKELQLLANKMDSEMAGGATYANTFIDVKESIIEAMGKVAYQDSNQKEAFLAELRNLLEDVTRQPSEIAAKVFMDLGITSFKFHELAREFPAMAEPVAEAMRIFFSPERLRKINSILWDQGFQKLKQADQTLFMELWEAVESGALKNKDEVAQFIKKNAVDADATYKAWKDYDLVRANAARIQNEAPVIGQIPGSMEFHVITPSKTEAELKDLAAGNMIALKGKATLTKAEEQEIAFLKINKDNPAEIAKYYKIQANTPAAKVVDGIVAAFKGSKLVIDQATGIFHFYQDLSKTYFREGEPFVNAFRLMGEHVLTKLDSISYARASNKLQYTEWKPITMSLWRKAGSKGDHWYPMTSADSKVQAAFKNFKNKKPSAEYEFKTEQLMVDGKVKKQKTFAYRSGDVRPLSLLDAVVSDVLENIFTGKKLPGSVANDIRNIVDGWKVKTTIKRKYVVEDYQDAFSSMWESGEMKPQAVMRKVEEYDEIDYSHIKQFVSEAAAIDAMKYTDANKSLLYRYYQQLERTDKTKLTTQELLRYYLLKGYGVNKYILPYFSQTLLLNENIGKEVMGSLMSRLTKYANEYSERIFTKFGHNFGDDTDAIIKEGGKVKQDLTIFKADEVKPMIDKLKHDVPLAPSKTIETTVTIPEMRAYIPTVRKTSEELNSERQIVVARAVEFITGKLQDAVKSKKVSQFISAFKLADKAAKDVAKAEVPVFTKVSDIARLTAKEEQRLVALGKLNVLVVADVTKKDKVIIKFLESHPEIEWRRFNPAEKTEEAVVKTIQPIVAESSKIADIQKALDSLARRPKTGEKIVDKAGNEFYISRIIDRSEAGYIAKGEIGIAVSSDKAGKDVLKTFTIKEPVDIKVKPSSELASKSKTGKQELSSQDVLGLISSKDSAFMQSATMGGALSPDSFVRLMIQSVENPGRARQRMDEMVKDIYGQMKETLSGVTILEAERYRKLTSELKFAKDSKIKDKISAELDRFGKTKTDRFKEYFKLKKTYDRLKNETRSVIQWNPSEQIISKSVFREQFYMELSRTKQGRAVLARMRQIEAKIETAKLRIIGMSNSVQKVIEEGRIREHEADLEELFEITNNHMRAAMDMLGNGQLDVVFKSDGTIEKIMVDLPDQAADLDKLHLDMIKATNKMPAFGVVPDSFKLIPDSPIKQTLDSIVDLLGIKSFKSKAEYYKYHKGFAKMLTDLQSLGDRYSGKEFIPGLPRQLAGAVEKKNAIEAEIRANARVLKELRGEGIATKAQGQAKLESLQGLEREKFAEKMDAFNINARNLKLSKSKKEIERIQESIALAEERIAKQKGTALGYLAEMQLTPTDFMTNFLGYAKGEPINLGLSLEKRIIETAERIKNIERNVMVSGKNLSELVSKRAGIKNLDDLTELEADILAVKKTNLSLPKQLIAAKKELKIYELIKRDILPNADAVSNLGVDSLFNYSRTGEIPEKALAMIKAPMPEEARVAEVVATQTKGLDINQIKTKVFGGGMSGSEPIMRRIAAIAPKENISVVSQLQSKGIKVVVDLDGIITPEVAKETGIILVSIPELSKERLGHIAVRGGIASEAEQTGMAKLRDLFWANENIALVGHDQQGIQKIISAFKGNYLSDLEKEALEASRILAKNSERMGRAKEFKGYTGWFQRANENAEIYGKDFSVKLTKALNPKEAVEHLTWAPQIEDVRRSIEAAAEKAVREGEWKMGRVDSDTPVMVMAPDLPYVNQHDLTIIYEAATKQKARIFFPSNPTKGERIIAEYLTSKGIKHSTVGLDYTKFLKGDKAYPYVAYSLLPKSLSGMRAKIHWKAHESGFILQPYELIVKDVRKKALKMFTDFKADKKKYLPEWIWGEKFKIRLDPGKEKYNLGGLNPNIVKGMDPEDALARIVANSRRRDLEIFFRDKAKTLREDVVNRLLRDIETMRGGKLTAEDFKFINDRMTVWDTQANEIFALHQLGLGKDATIMDKMWAGEIDLSEVFQELIMKWEKNAFVAQFNSYADHGWLHNFQNRILMHEKLVDASASIVYKGSTGVRWITAPLRIPFNVFVMSALYYNPAWYLRNAADDGFRAAMAARNVSMMLNSLVQHSIISAEFIKKLGGDLAGLGTAFIKKDAKYIAQAKRLTGHTLSEKMKLSLAKTMERDFDVFDFNKLFTGRGHSPADLKALTDLRRSGMSKFLEKAKLDGGINKVYNMEHEIAMGTARTNAGEILTKEQYADICASGLAEASSDVLMQRRRLALMEETSVWQRFKKRLAVTHTDVQLMAGLGEQLRRGLLVHELLFNKAMSLAEAKTKVWGHLFNYRDLTIAGKLLRVLFPFYAFTANAIRLYLGEALKRGPSVWIAANHLLDAWSQSTEELPDWARTKIQINDKTYWGPWLSVWGIMDVFRDPKQHMIDFANNPMKTFMGFGWGPGWNTFFTQAMDYDFFSVSNEVRRQTGWTDTEIKEYMDGQDLTKTTQGNNWMDLMYTYVPWTKMYKALTDVDTYMLVDGMSILKSAKVRFFMKSFGFNVFTWDNFDKALDEYYNAAPHDRNRIRESIQASEPLVWDAIQGYWAKRAFVNAMNARGTANEAQMLADLERKGLQQTYFDLEEKSPGSGTAWLERNPAAKKILQDYWDSRPMSSNSMMANMAQLQYQMNQKIKAITRLIEEQSKIDKAGIMGINVDFGIIGDAEKFKKLVLNPDGTPRTLNDKELDIIMGDTLNGYFTKNGTTYQDALAQSAKETADRYARESKLTGTAADKEYDKKMSALFAILPGNLESLSKEAQSKFWDVYNSYFENNFSAAEKQRFLATQRPWEQAYTKKMDEYKEWMNWIIPKEDNDSGYFDRFYASPQWVQDLKFYSNPNQRNWYPVAAEISRQSAIIKQMEDESGIFQTDKRNALTKYINANMGIIEKYWDKDHPMKSDYFKQWDKLLTTDDGASDYYARFFGTPKWFQNEFFDGDPDKQKYYNWRFKMEKLQNQDAVNKANGLYTNLADDFLWSAESAFGRSQLAKVKIDKDHSKLDYYTQWKKIRGQESDSEESTYFTDFFLSPQWFLNYYFRGKEPILDYYKFRMNLEQAGEDQYMTVFFDSKYKNARAEYEKRSPGIVSYMTTWKQIGDLMDKDQNDRAYEVFFDPKNAAFRTRYEKNHPGKVALWKTAWDYSKMPETKWEDKKARWEFLNKHPELSAWWQEGMTAEQIDLRMKLDKYFSIGFGIEAEGSGLDYYKQFWALDKKKKNYLALHPEVQKYLDSLDKKQTGEYSDSVPPGIRAVIKVQEEYFKLEPANPENMASASALYMSLGLDNADELKALNTEYFALDKDKRVAFVDAHPDLLAYWESLAKKKYVLAQYPGLKDYWAAKQQQKAYLEAHQELKLFWEARGKESSGSSVVPLSIVFPESLTKKKTTLNTEAFNLATEMWGLINARILAGDWPGAAAVFFNEKYKTTVAAYEIKKPGSIAKWTAIRDRKSTSYSNVDTVDWNNAWKKRDWTTVKAVSVTYKIPPVSVGAKYALYGKLMETWIATAKSNYFLGMYYFASLPQWAKDIYFKNHADQKERLSKPLDYYLSQAMYSWEKKEERLVTALKYLNRYGDPKMRVSADGQAAYAYASSVLGPRVAEDRSGWGRGEWNAYWTERTVRMNQLNAHDLATNAELAKCLGLVRKRFPLMYKPPRFGTRMRKGMINPIIAEEKKLPAKPYVRRTVIEAPRKLK